ncbi:putative ferric-chelate reductase 1 [Strongylocentrotus purpuratus]|uniref:Reelin domain-containing protein n=1 Tax=Strongylocentrotus purpuratus TaxID=7668 RepID=A0A7M7PE01_STRPU|nr:putative ferric-chelate reductase 1 [Strongylocentrotus purpuratus]XP_030849239.1 putative ferric-chelate reductase 1 [Strongylocentrotus purpuratus]
MNMWIISALLLSIATSAVVASPSGPPVSVDGLCASMVPGHGPSDAVGDAPYSVTAVEQDDNTFKVRFEGVGANSTFRGFFLQARPWDSSSSGESETTSLGVFTSSAAGTKQLDCFGSMANAWGHSINTDKSVVEGTWTPPAGSGEVRFRVSVVQGPASTYWTGLYSDVVMYESSAGKASLSLATLLGALAMVFFTSNRM